MEDYKDSLGEAAVFSTFDERGTDKFRLWTKIDISRPLLYAKNFVALSSCHLNYGMVQLHSDQKNMLHFQRLSGGLQRCISTTVTYSFGLYQNTWILLNTYYRIYKTLKLPESWGRVNFYSRNNELPGTRYTTEALRDWAAHDGCNKGTLGPTECFQIEIVSWNFCKIFGKFCSKFCKHCVLTKQKILEA